MSDILYRAKWQEPLENNAVQCLLCPRRCVIPNGKSGFCGVRVNRSGVLCSLAWGRPVALQNDPIEKKPLNHFLSGSRTFSIGTFGCNLGCVFCQNDSLSRGLYDEKDSELYPPDLLAELAVRHGCRSMAFTYNEPTVWAEYAADLAREAKKRGLATVLVSNGYITRSAAEELYPLIDAANIDVKGFPEDFYSSLCAGTLDPVLKSCEFFKKEVGGHLEITNLVIPGKNSDPAAIDALLDWAADSLGLDTPLHFSAYFPAYRCTEPPTPKALLQEIRRTAFARGFRHVHLGNV